MLRIVPLALLTSACLAAGCSRPTPPAPDADESPAAPTTEPQTAPAADAAELAAGNTRFAFDLYRRLAATDGTVVVSPFGISTALAMTSAGARGETAEEIAQTLHVTLPPDRLHAAFVATLRYLEPGRGAAYRLNLANALWGRRGFAPRPDFLELTARQYDGGFREADFAQDVGAARRSINAWVGARTGREIKELFRPNDLAPDTMLVLTNAVYFKGDWMQPFEESQTTDADFETASGTRVRVPMMRRGSRGFLTPARGDPCYS